MASTTTTEFVAFSVGSKKEFAPKTSSRVPMETVIYNEGDHFKSDNAFHAPFNGVYSFTFSVVANINSWADMNLVIQKEGSDQVAVARSVDRSGGAAGASVIIQLDEGETVSVWFGTNGSNYGIRATEGGVAPGAPCTVFSGKLEKKLSEIL